MPSHHLIRRDSWPPTILRLNNESTTDISDTDATPFAYFLAPAPPDSDDEDDAYLDLSAGIESDDAKTPQVREVSPSSLQRLPILSDEELAAEKADVEREMNEWLAVPSRRAKERAAIAREAEKRLLGAPRGRGIVRGAPGPARSRSAGPRGRAWREPSPEIGVIVEEGEEEDGSPGPSEVKSEGGGRKLRKKVHWATPVGKLV